MKRCTSPQKKCKQNKSERFSQKDYNAPAIPSASTQKMIQANCMNVSGRKPNYYPALKVLARGADLRCDQCCVMLCSFINSQSLFKMDLTDPDDESFYSINNDNEGYFHQNSLPGIEEGSHEGETTENPRIPQSSFSYHSDQQSEVDNYKVEGEIKNANIQIQPFLQLADVSAIEPMIQEIGEKEEHSASLLHEIQCLDISQVSPQELREIHTQINKLRSQQMSLQGSLRVAKAMIDSSKKHNEVIHEELQQVKQRDQIKNFSKRTHFDLLEISSNMVGVERRVFPQSNNSSHSDRDREMKNIYRQCSLRKEFCLEKVEEFEIWVSYERVRDEEGQDGLKVILRVQPRENEKGSSKSSVSLRFTREKEGNSRNEGSEFSNSRVQKYFSAWPCKKIYLDAEINIKSLKSLLQERRTLLVPLPITHFLQPRCFSIPTNSFLHLSSKLMSRYETNLTGNVIGHEWETILTQIWWGNKNSMISCLRRNQLMKVEIERCEQGKGWKVSVMGRKNSPLVLEMMEYLTFILTE